MKLSVITVCYNCKNEIKDTLSSVFEQVDKDFEYIIVDGKSSDGTMGVVKEYYNKIMDMVIISEEDTGIYDAMNKGARAARGEYIYFLNAGDRFYDKHVISNMKKYIIDKFDIIYGDIIADGRIISSKSKIRLYELIYFEKMICHQAMFVKRNLLLTTPFDIKYKICADRDWLIKVLMQNKTYYYVRDFIVAIYDTTGISSVSPFFYEESLELAKKYGRNYSVWFIKFKRLMGRVVRFFHY